MNQYLNKVLKTGDVDYVIASDTDSIYLCLDALVQNVFSDTLPEKAKIVSFLDKACQTQIEPFIEKSYQELADYMNAYDQKMQDEAGEHCRPWHLDSKEALYFERMG
jgi:hypothetical protein